MTNFNRAKSIQLKWVTDSSNAENELKTFFNDWTNRDLETLMYLKDLWSDIAYRQQLIAINSVNSNNSEPDDNFIKMCKNSTLSDLDKDVAMLCLEKLKK